MSPAYAEDANNMSCEKSSNGCPRLQDVEVHVEVMKAIAEERNSALENFKRVMKNDIKDIHSGIKEVSEKIDGLGQQFQQDVASVEKRVTIIETNAGSNTVLRRWKRTIYTGIFVTSVGSLLALVIKLLVG
jgi:hypothetical protein